GQAEGAEDPHAGGIADAPENQTVPATALLEHGPVSPRSGYREVFGQTVSRQSGMSSKSEQSQGPSGRTGPPSSGGWQDECVRVRDPVSRRRPDDLLAQAPERR